MDKLIALCKRRGFIFPSSAAYGGLQGLYDYGPLGIELKKHLKDAWWNAMVYERDDIDGLDAAILTHPDVFHYTGHDENFCDPMMDCRQCQTRWRGSEKEPCPQCQSTDVTEPRMMDLMFRVPFGSEGDKNACLRPETAQGIFLNFRHIADASSRKLPFGIAQIGKAFRNEVTVRQFIFRSREFEQMEVEFFVQPGQDDKWHQYWVEERVSWWKQQGLAEENLKLHKQSKEERAHYAKETVDILFNFPQGWEELEGIANRSDFDLGSHTRFQDELNVQARVAKNTASTVRMAMQNDDKKFFVPFVIEPSAGVDRGVLAVLTQAYKEEAMPNGTTRTVLQLKPHLAPCKVAIVPLAKNQPQIIEHCQRLVRELRSKKLGFVKMELSGNVGKSYRRHDEIGTPFCVTVDFQTLEDQTVTVRDRDTCAQSRISLNQLAETLSKLIDGHATL